SRERGSPEAASRVQGVPAGDFTARHARHVRSAPVLQPAVEVDFTACPPRVLASGIIYKTQKESA
ncbi:MAG: hypothetical protein IJU52_03140, partial [Clostridia bacterium]|nr:hypothetical protein [Clostridia bacterium]